MPNHPLTGLRVVECGGLTAAYAGRILADAGADVVRVVPPAGDPLAAESPFFGDSGVSIQATWYNLGKRAVSYDAAGLRSLIAAADVLIENWSPGSRLLSDEEVSELNPRLARVSVTHAGRDAEAPLVNDLVANALSGAASVTGEAGAPPLNGYGNQTHHTAGLYAAIGALAAWRAANVTGAPQHIDLSEHEALVSCTEQVLMQWFFKAGWPDIAQRQGSLHWSGAYAVYADRKGEGMMVTAALRFVDEVLPWMAADGMAGELTDPEKYPDLLSIVRNFPYVMVLLKDWVATKDADELFFEAQAKHLSWGPSVDVASAAASPQAAARDYYIAREVPGFGLAKLPLSIFRTEQDPPPPVPSAHVSVRDVAWEPHTHTPAVGKVLPPGRPLEGVRVLDFTHVLAGPFGTRVLADLGADVIKISTAARGGGANSTAHPYYLSWNRNKRSVNLNMADPRGIAIARDLAAKCDAVTENFSAGVLKRWGMDREALKAVHPAITVVSMGGMGQTGPWKKFVTFAPTIHALCGLTYLTAERGNRLTGYGFSLTDHLSGLAGAVAVLEGVEHARRTGQGLDIDLSQYELGLNLMGPTLIDHFANGVRHEAAGSHHPFGALAPHNIYPAAGDDAWVAIAVRDDEQWRAFCAVMGRGALATDVRFATHEARLANQDRLDRAVAEWTKSRDRFEIARLCQAAGIGAGSVQNAADLTATDCVLASREFFGMAEASGETPGHGVDRFPAFVNGQRPPHYEAAHPIGADTFDVLTGLLGMDDGAVAELMAEGVLT